MKTMVMTEQSVRAMVQSPEVRDEAVAIIDRLLAFVDRWREEYHRRSGPAAARTAIRRAKWMLDAIGAEILAYPTVNKEKKRGSERWSYLIFLKSPIGLQNFRLSASHEALFATIETKLQMIRDALIDGVEASEADWGHLGYESDATLEAKVRTLTDHAMQMQVWRRTGRVPMVVDDDVARAMAAVMDNRTREDWISAESHDSFWTCSADEFQQAGNLQEALDSFAASIGRKTEEFLFYTIDWKSPVTIKPAAGNAIAVHATREGARLKGFIPILVREGPLGRVQVGYDRILINPDQSLPASFVMKLREGYEGPLDGLIVHWGTKGRGWMIEGTCDRSRPGNSNAIELVVRKGDAQVLMFNPTEDEARKNMKLRDARKLRTTSSKFASRT